jgi:squalene-associated FAD-dependent desaturase
MPENTDSQANRIAIVGGGLAGLAAAVALIERGCAVELFEARRKLGGRAGSYLDQASGESIDHCQHVAMGCCTNFLDFCRRTEIEDLFVRHRTLYFFGPDGRRCDFCPTQWLPAPLHLIAPLFALNYLSLRDKLGIARAMLRLLRLPTHEMPICPTVLDWLQAQQQSQAALAWFWKVVLVSALAESLDRASLAAARKVFVDGFLSHPNAANVLVPRVSLGALYDQRVADWLRNRRATIHLESPVEMVSGGSDHVSGLRLGDGSERAFDFVIVAVPWQRATAILAPEMRSAVDPNDAFASISSAPISSVHLWFDRKLTDLPHAVLVERLSQWVFARTLDRQPSEHYYQVVISASHDLAGRPRESVVDEVFSDLKAVFMAAKAAKLLRWQLITEQQAVFSVRPGLDAIRPLQQTAISNLLLAGDWTRTGWPATMEGAIRSGYLAAEAVLSHLGRPERFLVPDLPGGILLRGLGMKTER